MPVARPKPRAKTGTHGSAADLEVEQKVAGRRLDVAGQRQSPRQPPVEELPAVHVHGRRNDKAQLVD
jgi:hypothetical protein